MPTDGNTMRPLFSERLADLSQRAKAAEDAFAAARTENKQKLEAEIAQARTAVERFKEKVQQDASFATDAPRTSGRTCRAASRSESPRSKRTSRCAKRSSRGIARSCEPTSPRMRPPPPSPTPAERSSMRALRCSAPRWRRQDAGVSAR